MTLPEVIRNRIGDRGPIPFATYATLALYHPILGYYARAGQRSGRAGDFYTSVDLGPLFGRLLGRQCAEMWRLLPVSGDGDGNGDGVGPAVFDMVEAAAGNGRLARDLLESAAAEDASFYDAIHLHLVERSAAARGGQRPTLGRHAPRLASSGSDLPSGIRGVVFANELLDALPPHVLCMTGAGLREVYVDVAKDGDGFIERLGPVSARAQEHVDRHRITLEPGWRAEVTPDAVDWVERAVASIDQGFLLLVDYGHEAQELYSATHAAGTLATYRAHRASVAGDRGPAPWLTDPGGCDITAHVDLTAVREAAERAGATTLGVMDQTYFLLGLGALEAVDGAAEAGGVAALRNRLALKSLLVPGGLGSTHKVLIFGKGVGRPPLAGCAYSLRVT